MHFIFENCTECGIHFAKEKKLELSLSVYIDLIFLTMLTNITYSADVLGPFSKGGGGLFGLMRRYVYFVWWNFILQYQLFFVTSAGFVFNMYTYQV